MKIIRNIYSICKDIGRKTFTLQDNANKVFCNLDNLYLELLTNPYYNKVKRKVIIEGIQQGIIIACKQYGINITKPQLDMYTDDIMYSIYDRVQKRKLYFIFKTRKIFNINILKPRIETSFKIIFDRRKLND